MTQSQALDIATKTPLEELLRQADELRTKHLSNVFDTCSIMNARSGRCSENCAWCSQSAHHKCEVEIYPLVSADEALHHALYNHRQGIGRFSLVTSGRKMSVAETQKAADIYRQIGQKCDIYLCASMGLLGKDELQTLWDAGVRRYHCNIETAPSYFPTLCTTHTIDEKIQTIRAAQQVGMTICSGGIIGMGETMAQRIEMALLLNELGVDSIPINILNPIPGTRLEHHAPLSDEDILRTFAIFRVINPTVHIRFAGGRQAVAGIVERALKGGISGAIVGDLLTTLGSTVEQDKALINKLGLSAF